MYDYNGKQRINAFLEDDNRFKIIDTIIKWRRFDTNNYTYYDLPQEKLNWKDISAPDFYGSNYTDTWYQCDIDVPNESDIFFKLNLQTDSLVIINNREKYFAINPFHHLVPLDEWRGNTITLTISIFDGYYFPGYHPREKERVLATVANRIKSYPLIFEEGYIVKKNIDSYELYYDVFTLNSLLDTLAESSLEYQKIVSTIHKALMKIDHGNDNFDEKVIKEIREEIRPLLELKNASLSPTIFSEGAAHLDHAWLWPQKETIRKAARTLAQMTSFMEGDDNFKFLFSQPLQIQLVKEYYPKIFDGLYKQYKRGNFDPNGVGYIEPDCMLSSGEGLIRNILVGRQTTSELFPSFYGDTFYVPDSFGYMYSLPQILTKSKIKYIVTSKLGWNDTTKHPYDIFNWKGIDGTTIKAHMIQGAYEGTEIPLDNYNKYQQIRNKDIQEKLFRPIGEGDGGGGTTLDDIELIKRQKNLQGLPKNSWKTISESMNEIFKNTDIPTFDGELYLELHRGTYTTQAKIKYYHRRVDKMLHNVEYLLSYCFVNKDFDVDRIYQMKSQIDVVWKKFLINQFHDILPGSCVRIVNEEAIEDYEMCLKILNSLKEELAPKGNKFLNLTPYTVNNCKAYHSKLDDKCTTVEAQIGLNKLPWGTVNILATGEIDSLKIDNNEFCKGKFNKIVYGQDYPVNWDAWNVEKDDFNNLYRVKGTFENGIRNITFEGGSKLTQKIVIHKDKSRIDFITTVKWMENHKIIRTNFENTIKSDFSTYDIPFGYINRTNKDNTNLERARFELPGCEYLTQHDEKNSISLITDSKYGYKGSNGNLSVSLLRSPKAPDETADMGIHNFIYSIYISDNKLLPIISEAAIINNPLLKCNKDYKPLVDIDYDNIITETVKIAENNKGLIFRFRECLGINCKPKIIFDDRFELKSLKFVNFMEEDDNDDFDFAPFKIKNVFISLKS